MFRTAHTEFPRRRREWFEKVDDVSVVLWWVPAGHRPSVKEAVERLDHLRANGPTAHAFIFRRPFETPEAPPAAPEAMSPGPA